MAVSTVTELDLARTVIAIIVPRAVLLLSLFIALTTFSVFAPQLVL